RSRPSRRRRPGPSRSGRRIETPRRAPGRRHAVAVAAYSLAEAFFAFGAAFAVAFGAAFAVVAFFGAALAAVFVAVALAVVALALGRVEVDSGVGVAVDSAAACAAASARAVLLSAARALPAAVWAPLALPALPAAIRAFAAFCAAALPVVFTTRPPAWTCSPPSAALTFRVSRELRRAAAFGWIAPALAARSSALSASARAASGSIVDAVGL